MSASKSKYFSSDRETMHHRILAYLQQLEPPIGIDLPGKNVHWLHPHGNPETRRCMNAFYSKYYADDHERILVLGINPGRFGGGTTGTHRFKIFLTLVKTEDHGLFQNVDEA